MEYHVNDIYFRFASRNVRLLMCCGRDDSLTQMRAALMYDYWVIRGLNCLFVHDAHNSWRGMTHVRSIADMSPSFSVEAKGAA